MTEPKDEFKELQDKLRAMCPHKHEQMVEEAGFNSRSASLDGTVICLDCGRKRSWNAY